MHKHIMGQYLKISIKSISQVRMNFIYKKKGVN